MEKQSCAFFGHRNFNYTQYESAIRETVEELINRGVTDFYNGYRGRFDCTCARIVHGLKKQYPQIKNIMVLSYPPSKNFEKPEVFDETVYLLEKGVPAKFAISHTNRKLVETVDYVVSGVVWKWGDAKSACDYARRLSKTIFYTVTGETYCNYYRLFKQIEEEMNDERVRTRYEQKTEQLIAKLKPQFEANWQKSHKTKK